MGITHTFVSGIADGADETLVRPVDWNAAHSLGTGERLPIVIRKTAETQVVSNSTTLVNDDALLLAVAANEVWQIFVILRWITTAAAGMKQTFTIPTNGALTLQGLLAAYNEESGTTTKDISGTGVNRANITRYLYVGGATAGNIQYQWAQTTAEVSNTKVLTNSFLLAYKLA